jgi:hypothetical protein
MVGKSDSYRPVDQEKFGRNYDRIFRKDGEVPAHKEKERPFLLVEPLGSRCLRCDLQRVLDALDECAGLPATMTEDSQTERRRLWA